MSDLASTWEAREKQYSRQALDPLPLEVKLFKFGKLKFYFSLLGFRWNREVELVDFFRFLLKQSMIEVKH